MTDRETGALTIFTQGAVGTAEPERSTYHDIHERLEFTHRDYAQAEYGARLMADAIVRGASRDVSRPGAGGGPVRARGAAWTCSTAGIPVPSPTPTRASRTAAPTVPACRSWACPTASARRPGPRAVRASTRAWASTRSRRRACRCPENVSAPSYAALQEDVNVHLQAFRIGDILFTACSCEQWKDQTREHPHAHRQGRGQRVPRLRLGRARRRTSSDLPERARCAACAPRC